MWVKLFSISKQSGEAPFLIEQYFTGFSLIIKAVCYTAKPTWRRAGYLYPEYDVFGIGKVRGKSQQVYLGSQLIYFEDSEIINLIEPKFRFYFQCQDWIPDIELTFWQYEGTPVSQEYQYVNIITRLNEIEAQLDRIEEQLNTTTGQ